MRWPGYTSITSARPRRWNGTASNRPDASSEARKALPSSVMLNSTWNWCLSAGCAPAGTSVARFVQ
jgi:hypothetical protein